MCFILVWKGSNWRWTRFKRDEIPNNKTIKFKSLFSFCCISNPSLLKQFLWRKKERGKVCFYNSTINLFQFLFHQHPNYTQFRMWNFPWFCLFACLLHISILPMETQQNLGGKECREKDRKEEESLMRSCNSVIPAQSLTQWLKTLSVM